MKPPIAFCDVKLELILFAPRCGIGIIVVIIFLKLAIVGITQIGTLSNNSSAPTLSQM